MPTKQEQIQGGETSSAENPSLQELLEGYQSVSERIETTKEEIAPGVKAGRAKIAEFEQRIEEVTAPLRALEDRQGWYKEQIARIAFAETDGKIELSVDPITAWLLRDPTRNSPEQVQQWVDKINSLNERIEASPQPFIYINLFQTNIGLLEGSIEPDRGRYPEDFKAPISHTALKAGMSRIPENVIDDPKTSQELRVKLSDLLNCKTSTQDIRETSELFNLDGGFIVGEEAVRSYFEAVAAYYAKNPTLAPSEGSIFHLWLDLKNTGVDCTDLLPEGQSLEKFKQHARGSLARYMEKWVSPYHEVILSSSLVQMLKLTGVTAAEARDYFESIASADDDLSDRDRAKLRELFEIDLKYEFRLVDEVE